MWPGVRPIMRLASMPTASGRPSRGVHGDHRRFVEHHTAPAHVDERVGSSQVDRDVAADDTGVPGLGHRRPPARLARSRNPTEPRRCSATPTWHPKTPHAQRESVSRYAGKNSAISRAADSGPSLPWTRFSVSSIARSPRTVPGAASLRIGRAHQRAHDLPRVRPLDHHRDERRACDEGDEIVEERLALVFGVVLLRRRRVELAELDRNDAQTFAFETPDDLADEVRSTASGLQSTSVRSLVVRHGGARLPDRKSALRRNGAPGRRLVRS